MASSIPSFLFGAGTKYKTQEELDRAREQVRALLGDIGESKFTGWGSFLADIGKGLGAGLEQRRINEGQEGLEAAQAPFSQTLAEIAGGYGGGGGTDVLVGGGGSDSMAGGGGGDKVSEDAIRQGLIDRGLPPHVAEGFVMNMKDESGLRTGIRESQPNAHGGRGFGLYQTTGPREVALRRFAAARGTSPTDLNTTLDFLVHEGQTTEKAAFDRILNTRTPGEAGAAIVSNFLRPAKKHEIARRNKYLSADLSGGGGSDAQAGGGAGDSFLQAKPNRRRMTPAMLEQEAGTEKRPIWDNGFSLQGRRRMTPAMGFEVNPAGAPLPDPGFDANPAGSPLPDPGFEVNPASPLDGRRRMTPAMINPVAAPAPAPMPAPDPARFGPTPPVPVAAPIQAPNPDRFGGPTPFAPPAPQIFTPPAAPTGNRLGSPPPSMAGTETAPYPVPGNSMAGTETAPPQFTPTPARMPAPIARVDPFTDMILGDKASQFKPGNVSATPPAETARGLAAARQLTPFGANVFPAAPPAPGTPAAAGFGVPQHAMAGGGGSNTQAGGGGGQFPPAPAAPGQQGGGNKIAKLMTILSSPYASDEQKRMATAMLQREYDLQDKAAEATAKANDPVTKLQIEKARLEIEKLKSEGKSVIPMTPEMRQAFGIPDSDTRPWMLVDGKPDLVGGANAPSSGIPKPDEEAVSSVRKEIRQLPQTEVLAQAAPIYRDMVKAADRTGKVSDISLVMGLGKILDPKSVVREGEQIVVKNAASLPQWLQGQIDALNGGAELTPDTRQKILAEAHSRVNSYSDEYTNATEFFRQMATRRGYDPLDLIQDFGKFEPWVPTGAGGANDAGWTVMPNGTKVRKKGP